MPELPEVETVRRILLPILKNRVIESVDVLYPKMILESKYDFTTSLKNAKFLDVKRKGKYLLFYLDNNLVLISHLRMEGKYIVLSENETKTSHARVIFHLDHNFNISYDDTRCFGIMKLISSSDVEKEEMLAKLGPEPFDIKDYDSLLQKFSRITNPIKTAIMDQTIIAGLGNIYADEVLFLSKINPLTPAKKITKNQVEQIISNAVIVLNKAIELGGSTVKSYHAAKGVDGKFQNELLAYGKKDKKCPICDYQFKKIFVNGRGTTYCPRCQKLEFDTKVVAIVGKIASGKSTALNAVKALGYNVISSDEIVHNLYTLDSVKQTIARNFKNCLTNGEVDKSLLKEIVNENEKKKYKLESIIHPLVEHVLLENLSQSKTPLTFIEVPLLFEANLDYLADYIIGIDVSEEKQIENLKKRGVDDLTSYLKLNASTKFDANKSKMDFITSKDINVTYLEKEIMSFVSQIKEKEGIN